MPPTAPDPDAPLAALGDLTPRAFLREHWQKKPLLVRGAFPDAEAVLAPDALRALARRDDAVSRLVLAEGGEVPWELRHGPFSARELRALPPRGWALLVQEVDRFVPAARALLDPFAFVPRWRIDDVMASLAPAGAGVGAHVDHYDVFLLQGRGRRRWRIGNAPVEDDTVLPDLDVAILADFRWTDEYVLDPGDLLYLPPRVAHEGVALDECLTLSIGFRAPSNADVLAGFLEHALRAASDEAFYEDPDLEPTRHPGEIAPEALARARAVLRAAVDDDALVRTWFGAQMTEARRLADPDDFDDDAPGSGDGAFDPDEPDDDVPTALTAQGVVTRVRAGAGLRHRPAARLAYVRHGGGATLFADGEAYELEPGLATAAPLLADAEAIPAATLAPHLATPDLADLVAALVEAGALVWDDEAGETSGA